MVFESADILVKAGMEQEFERGVAQSAPLFQRARGCKSMQLQRGVENPLAYRLLVQWETVEDHMVHFRDSDDFQKWRELVGHCFDAAPAVTHQAVVLQGF
jgi:heme-degrading monooxygenase HmoA